MRIEKSNEDTFYINIKNNKSEGGKDSSRSKKNGTPHNTVFAGNLKLNKNNMEDKKQQAQNKALKTLMNQFKNEENTDEAVSKLKDKSSELLKNMDSDTKTIRDLEQRKKELMDSYEITDDSEEQKDLKKSEDENMALYLRSIQHPKSMQEEDKKKLQSVMDSLTDYQKDAFHMDAMDIILRGRVKDASNGISSINSAITGISQDKLKSHAMVDAQKEAEKTIKEANKEIISALVQQAKDKVDKKMEENKDKVEKEQKEQDKKEAEAEKAKQERIESTNSTSNKDNNSNTQTAALADTSISQADQQQLLDNIKKVVDQQKVTMDDIKGIVVDEQA